MIEVETSFSREMAQTPIFNPLIPGVNFPKRDYTEYMLFCMKSRLEPILYQLLGDDFTITFLLRPQESRLKNILFLVVEYKDKILSQEDKAEIKNILGEHLKEMRNNYFSYVLMFDTNMPLKVNSAMPDLPSSWIQRVFPFYFKAKKTEWMQKWWNENVEDLFLFDPATGYLFVDLSHFDSSGVEILKTYENPVQEYETIPDYMTVYQEMMLQIAEDLKELYLKGTIVCDMYFARDWNLSKLYDTDISSEQMLKNLEEAVKKELLIEDIEYENNFFEDATDLYDDIDRYEFYRKVDETFTYYLLYDKIDRKLKKFNPLKVEGLFQANWWDARVRGMTKFLLERQMGQKWVWITPFDKSFNFKDNKVQAHNISLALQPFLKGVPIIVAGSSLAFPADNYEELFLLLNSAYYAKNDGNGFIQTIIIAYDVQEIELIKMKLDRIEDLKYSSFTYYRNSDYNTCTISVLFEQSTLIGNQLENLLFGE